MVYFKFLQRLHAVLIILAAIAASVFVYLPSMPYGFSQDDFIHLSAAQATNIFEFFNFFNPAASYSDIFFYRPLATQAYFFMVTRLFGLNPTVFHGISLVFHLINVCLFYLVVSKIWHDKRIAYGASFLYGISAAHFLSLYYISAFQELAKTTFILISVWFFLRNQEKYSRLYYFGSIFAFILALLCKETAIITPALFIPLYVLATGSPILASTKLLIKALIPFVCIMGVYLGFRFGGLGSVFGIGGYGISLNIANVLQNLKWYTLWSFGLPEVISSYPSLGIDSVRQFMNDFAYARQTIGLFFIVVVSLLLSLIRRLPISIMQIVIGSVIILLALSPVLLLVEHKYPQYLDIPFIIILPWLMIIWISAKGIFRIFAVIGMCAFVVLQLYSLQISRNIHWTTNRATVASVYQQKLANQYPNLANNSVVIFTGTPQGVREVSVALAKHYALSIWYPGIVRQVIYLTDTQPMPYYENMLVIPIDRY